MRILAVPIVFPVAVAITALLEWGDFQSTTIATEAVAAVGAIALVLAVISMRRRVPRNPVVFVSCWILGALALLRATMDLIWRGAHATIDLDALTHELAPAMMTLAVGLFCALAAISLQTERRAR